MSPPEPAKLNPTGLAPSVEAQSWDPLSSTSIFSPPLPPRSSQLNVQRFQPRDSPAHRRFEPVPGGCEVSPGAWRQPSSQGEARKGCEQMGAGRLRNSRPLDVVRALGLGALQRDWTQPGILSPVRSTTAGSPAWLQAVLELSRRCMPPACPQHRALSTVGGLGGAQRRGGCLPAPAASPPAATQLWPLPPPPPRRTAKVRSPRTWCRTPWT